MEDFCTPSKHLGLPSAARTLSQNTHLNYFPHMK